MSDEPYNTIIEIHDENGIRTIDMTPVNEYLRIIKNSTTEEGIHKRRLMENTSKLLELTKEMNKEQLEYLVSSLTGTIGKNADLVQGIYDDPEKFYKQMSEYKELIKKADKTYKEMRLDAKMIRRIESFL